MWGSEGRDEDNGTGLASKCEGESKRKVRGRKGESEG